MRIDDDTCILGAYFRYSFSRTLAMADAAHWSSPGYFKRYDWQVARVSSMLVKAAIAARFRCLSASRPRDTGF